MPEQTELPPSRNSLHPKADASYLEDMEARVAVLEQIAKDTKDVLVELKLDMREMRQEMREMRQDQRNDFRILFGAIITAVVGLAGVMAHGFHWF